MNINQLRKAGIPEDCIPIAQAALRSAVQAGIRGKVAVEWIKGAVLMPGSYVDHEHCGELAKAIIADSQAPDLKPIPYALWGSTIDAGARAQMEQSCSIPSAVAAAIMPDGHVGYGLPIGGVLATENTVVPYGVGVDIACRMKVTVLDMPPETLSTRSRMYIDALTNKTKFGIGVEHTPRQTHAVMDADWSVTRTTRENKERAWNQLGTSGSGNHFVEFGTIEAPTPIVELGLEAGTYVAIMSHSGSRGVGSAVCKTYSTIAQSRLPRRYQELGRLAWLDMDSEAGKEYWLAMQLMGDYASANHAVIHRLLTKEIGAHSLATIENHHNFAWLEEHNGKQLIVHRKGATPAGKGVLGVIPGTMGDPAFIVRGLGNDRSLHSASHGAGRAMSRTAGKAKYSWKAVQGDLAAKGITVLAAGADEAPGVYKDIRMVMAEQTDLVESIAQFNPKIVMMCGDGSKSED